MAPAVALVAGFALVACQPEPVQVASHPNQRTLTSVSGNGRYVVVGTQNDNATQASTASLSILDRDVNGNGKLDEANDTSYTTFYGVGGSATGIDIIDDASLFVPDISDDGTALVFEAFDPNLPYGSNDCVYEIAIADLGAVPPDLVDCQTIITVRGRPTVATPGYMSPTIANSGTFVSYVKLLNRHSADMSIQTAAFGPRIWSSATQTSTSAAVMEDGSVPVAVAGNAPDFSGAQGSPAISADGGSVVFATTWPLTFALRNARGDFAAPKNYIYDRVSGTTRDLTLDTPYPSTSYPDGFSSQPGISHDGRFVSLTIGYSHADPDRVATGSWAPVYLLDRDTDNDGVFDETGATSVRLVSEGYQPVTRTQVDAGDTIVDGHESVRRVGWSAFDPNQSLNVAAARNLGSDQASAGQPKLTPPHENPRASERGETGSTALPGFASPIPGESLSPDQVPTSSTTTTTSPSTATESSSTTTTSSTSPSTGLAPSSTTITGQGSSSSATKHAGKVSGIALEVNGGTRLTPGGTPMSAGSANLLAATPQAGGVLEQISVRDLASGAVSQTTASGLGQGTMGNPSIGEDVPMRWWGFSADGSTISWEVVDSALTSHAMYRKLVFPWVANPASTFGFQPYDAYAADPVNLATGSFTNTATDLPAPGGVYGLDFTRTYNSADPITSTLGIGWVPSFASAVFANATQAMVRYDNGKQVVYTLSGGSYVAPTGEANTLVRNGNGTWTLTFPSGEHWDYAPNGVLVKRTAADGQRVELTYTSPGLTGVTAYNAAGNQDGTLTFTYDTNGFLSGVVSSTGQSVSYNVTDQFLTSFTDVNAKTWSFTPDGLGRILTETDPTGSTIVTNVYDYAGRIYQQTSAAGTVTTITYDPTSGTTTVKDVSTGTSLTYVVDKTGRVTKVTDPDKNNAAITYTNGYPTKVVSRNGVTQTGAYDSAGNLLWFRDPAKTNQSNVSDPNAGKTVYTYDSQNRVKTATQPNGTTTTYCYTASGGCYTGTFPRPYKVTVTDSSSAQVAETTYTYNTDGTVASVTDPDGVVTAYSDYTTAGQPQTVSIGGNTTHYTFNADGTTATMTDPRGNETDYTYDASGNLTKTVGPYATSDTNPIEVVNTYDDAGRLLTTIGPAYRNDATKPVTTNCYDTPGSSCESSDSGQLMTTTDPKGGVTHYAYNANGLLWKTTDPNGNVSENHYADLGRVDYELDGAGLKTSYAYDADGNQVGVSTPTGQTTGTNFNSSGQVTSSVVGPTSPADPSPDRTTTLSYDQYGRQNSTTDPTGATTTTNTFDALNRPTQTTDARGGVTQVTYTPAGKVLTTTDPSGLVTTNCYDLPGSSCHATGTGLLMSTTGPALASDPTPPVTQFQYDASGRKTYEQGPAGDITQWTYTPAGKVESATAPNGVETDYTYDARGNTLTESRLKNTDQSVYSTITYEYDLNDNLTKVTDANGKVTTYAYDANGNRLNVTDPESQGAIPAHFAQQWTYDPDNRIATLTDGLGRVTTNHWNATTGLLDGTDDPSGRTTSYGYDFAGEATSRQHTHGATTDPAVAIAYDANGRPTTATDPSVGTTSYSYDPAGDLITAATPGGRTTRYSYDSAGRRVKTLLPDGQAYEYSYDNEGHVDTITPNQVMADTFTGTDGARIDPSKWTFVSSATIQSNQARLGLNATTALAGMIAYPLSSADQNTAITYRFADNTDPQTFSLAARVSGSGSYKVMIDSNSTTAHLAKVTGSGTATNLASFTVPKDTATHRVRLEVVGSTIRARVWDPAASEPSTWDVSVTDSTYTAAGFVIVTTSQTGTASTSVDVDDFTEVDPSDLPGPVASYGYDPAGRVTSAVLAGGVQRGWHYTDGLLDTYTQTGVGGPVSDVLAYDPVGRLVSVNATAKVFAYDPMDQLTSQTIGSTTTTFGYDGNGRRISMDQGSTHLVYSYDAGSQLSSISDGTAYTYDPAGRRLTVAAPGFSATYGYDTAGRLGTLTTTKGSATTTETRTYDPFNTLIGLSDQTGATTTSSVYDWNQDTQNPQLTGSTVNQATTDLLGLDSTDVTLTSGVAAGTSQDNFGSITATPTGANLKACTSGYDAWGNPTSTPATATIPCLGYRDQISTNNVYYNQARNYDPSIGAFTTTDPAQGTPGNAAATALYPYANNDPIANTDPTGNYAVTDSAAWSLNGPNPGPSLCHGTSTRTCSQHQSPPTCEQLYDQYFCQHIWNTEPYQESPTEKSNMSILGHMAQQAVYDFGVRRFESRGKCGSLSIDVGVSYHANGCFMTHSGDAVYSVGTQAFGVGGAQASFSADVLWSNATSIEDLRGSSMCISLGARVGVAGVGGALCAGTTYNGPDLNHVNIQPFMTGLWVGSMGVSVGPSAPGTVSVTFGETNADKVVSCPSWWGVGHSCRAAVRLALRPTLYPLTPF